MNRIKTPRLLFSLLMLLPFLSLAGNGPVELGNVHWLRDYDQALSQADQAEKPVLILFQEVPGCATCTRYGSFVLSHPLIVEAIENEFVPLAIYNNERGKDAEVLKRYDEPSWNNPVVRVVNAEGENVVQRLSSNYGPSGLLNTMIQALEAQKRTVPAYLRLLQEEWAATENRSEQVYFSMGCFWTGEAGYGQLEGVTATRPGFMHGREVVEVTYNPEFITAVELAQHGVKQGVASSFYAADGDQRKEVQTALRGVSVDEPGSFREDCTPKYYLAQTALAYLPMTPTQKSRINALVGKRGAYMALLSPQQKELLAFIQAHPKLDWKATNGSVEFVQSWKQALMVRESAS